MVPLLVGKSFSSTHRARDLAMAPLLRALRKRSPHQPQLVWSQAPAKTLSKMFSHLHAHAGLHASAPPPPCVPRVEGRRVCRVG